MPENLPPQPISACIVCMNRLHDLCRTLPANLSVSYPRVEFVLLDYNSTDGLHEWISTVRSDRLRYHRTDRPKFYVPCHSKNAAARLAENDIVINLDADNLVSDGFLEGVNACFPPGVKVVAVPDRFLRVPDRIMLKGRVAMRKGDFLSLGGYDEDMDVGWGGDDMDLVFRAVLSGFSLARFDTSSISRLDTTDDQRTANMASRSLPALKEASRRVSSAKLARRRLIANEGRSWGQL